MPPRPSRAVTRSEVDALHQRAACRNAAPELFDSVDMLNAAPALAYCAQCHVIALCDRVISPKSSHYDGVAAASVWRGGRRLGGLTHSGPAR